MIPMTWENYATIARFYLEAATRIPEIRQRSVQMVELAAALRRSAPQQARRLAVQAELMEKDPLGTYYGRHKGGALRDEIRTPLEWPGLIPASEWQPVNDAVENMELARAAMQASFDLMARTS